VSNNPVNVTDENVRGLIYRNGTIVNKPGQGPGGSDISQLIAPATTYGFNCGIFWCADDFIIPTNESWTIDSIVFFSYQTGSTTTSTFNGARAQIWNGNPTTGGTVVWGDTGTNIYSTSYFSNIYRATDLITTNRPVMKIRCNTSHTFAAGTYWLQWKLAGTLASGPWCPPDTGAATATTYNAKQLSSVWINVIDAGSTKAQDLPFILYGTVQAGVKEYDKSVNISIYPNPCKDELNINTEAYSNLKINDISGRLIINQKLEKGINKINTSDLSKGVYLINISTENYNKVEKLIIQ
jgi:hypothetical protein